MITIRTACIVLALTALPAWAAPLSNEDLLALRTAEHVAETGTSARHNRHHQMTQAFELISPVLDRELPASKPVWRALGRWAAAGSDAAAGAVALAGLRREHPDFMADEELADLAARLNANTMMRELASEAAARLEAGDSPLAAIRHLSDRMAWRVLQGSTERIEEPGTAFAVWATLGAAFERAGEAEFAAIADSRAETVRSRLIEQPTLAEALVDAAEGQILFGRTEAAVRNLVIAREIAESLQVGEGRVDLMVNIGRLFARAGETASAQAMMEQLSQPIASQVAYEIARHHAEAGDAPATRAAAKHAESEPWRSRSRVLVVEAIARASGFAEAHAAALALDEPLAKAEALAVLSFLDPTRHDDRAESARLIALQTPGPERVAAVVRVALHAARLLPDSTEQHDLIAAAERELMTAHRLFNNQSDPFIYEAFVGFSLLGRTDAASSIGLGADRERREDIFRYQVMAQAAEILNRP